MTPVRAYLLSVVGETFRYAAASVVERKTGVSTELTMPLVSEASARVRDPRRSRPRMRSLAAVAVALSLALASAAGVRAAVHRLAFTASVSPGDETALTVAVSPRARCTIEVVYDTVVS